MNSKIHPWVEVGSLFVFKKMCSAVAHILHEPTHGRWRSIRKKKGVFPSVLISLLVVVVLSVEMGEMG